MTTPPTRASAPLALRQTQRRFGLPLLLAATWLALNPMGAGAQQAATTMPAASAPAPTRPASAAAPVAKRGSAVSTPALPKLAKSTWAELTPEQKTALAPLAGSWATLGEPQQRKWLAFTKNYAKLAPAEQDKLHSRMKDWAALSPQQRDEARMNFAQVKQLSATEKAANWQAYQALSPEEKQKLAAKAQAQTKLPGATATVKPIAPQKLAVVPVTRASKPVAQASHPAPHEAPAAVPSAPLPAVHASDAAPATAQKL